MKSRALPVAVAVAIIGCVLAVSANVTTSKMQDQLMQERYLRMVAERNLEKAKGQIQGLESDFADAKNKIDNIQGILTQGKSANAQMNSELSSLRQESQTLRQQVVNLQQELQQEMDKQQQAASTN